MWIQKKSAACSMAAHILKMSLIPRWSMPFHPISLHPQSISTNSPRVTNSYKEHETVVLLHNHYENGLRAGDVGAIVCVYENTEAYDVEFTRADGRPVAI